MRAFPPGSLLLLAIFVVLVTPVRAADSPSGAATFRSSCAFCHGINGKGGRGPTLVSARVVRNTSDESLQGIIKSGIPGTGMPAFDMEPDDMTALVTHVRSLAGTDAKFEEVPGDPVHGREIYASNGCANCHRIGATGSVYGPELTRIGASRSAAYLRESIVDPSADIAPEFEGLTVLSGDGKRSTGVRVNEDTFTVQVRRPDGHFASWDKSDVRSVEPLKQSLMPPYRLPADQLTDLVAYLAGLRGESVSGDVNKLQGIH